MFYNFSRPLSVISNRIQTFSIYIFRFDRSELEKFMFNSVRFDSRSVENSIVSLYPSILPSFLVN